MIDYDTEQIISAELALGENLLWSGRPPDGLRLTGRDLFMIPFSIMWGGFAIAWESLVVLKGAPLLFRLWGIPFVLIGLYIMSGSSTRKQNP
jgi:hypothetical protein